jgi:hypothetical protein
MSQTDVLATAIDAKAAGSWHSGGLDAWFRHDPQVFVAGDLLWYPVEGNNRLSTAPDVMVAFGRPKVIEDRTDYGSNV